MVKMLNKIAAILTLSLLPIGAFAEAESYLHYTRVGNVTEAGFAGIRNDLILRTYGPSASGYIVPTGYRIVKQTRNLCVEEIDTQLVHLVEVIFENAEELDNYSGRSIMAKIKVAGVDWYTVTKRGEIVNRWHKVRRLAPGDYDMLSDHFAAIVEASDC